MVEGHGVPLSIVASGANRHDSAMLEPLLADRFVPSDPSLKFRANLCLDAGYVGRKEVVAKAGYVPHIRSRGEEKREIENSPDFHTRRWVVEAFHSWLKRFRKLCPRYEKTDRSFLALLHLAEGIIAFNKVIFICG